MTWPNSKIARIASMTGAGMSSNQIADELADGTTAASIRARWSEWGIAPGTRAGRREQPVEVTLPAATRKRLAERAAAIGIAGEEYLRRIALCAIDDDLYAAVTDGRFD